MNALPFNVMLAVILAGGWLSGKLFARARLPAILGMVVFGIACSLTIKDAAPAMLWEINPYLKSFALIVILLRAGLHKSYDAKEGRAYGFLMAWVPCVLKQPRLHCCFMRRSASAGIQD